MKKKTKSRLGVFLWIAAAVCAVSGCSEKENPIVIEEKEKVTQHQTKQPQQNKPEEKAVPDETVINEAVINEVDYSDYFKGFEGCAVFYMPEENRYDIYNMEMAREQHSPCSTFKIISTLAGLKNGVIDPEHSVRPWSGETFWNEAWNGDIGLEDAFASSCVWYFREVIDEIGEDAMGEVLRELSYGNQDISDWKGTLNENNQNPALTGFWIESSLKISPKEQTEVLNRIFGEDAVYGEELKEKLKSVMFVEQEQTESAIYGKTGTGKLGDTFLDVWFTGMFVKSEQTVYFAVYLGETNHPDMSSKIAKDIAIHILAECYE